MKRYALLGLLVLAIGLGPLSSAVAVAEEQTVSQVVVVDVTGGVDTYVKEIEKAKAIMKRLGIKASIRTWQAIQAGERTGAVVVAVEYPTMAAYADGYAKLNADSEWKSWLEGLDRIRTVVSSGLYRELSP